MKYQKQTGFTLVELAIVLVVIGLILGMAFKGKDLIDSAKVKSMQAQVNKVNAAFNIYYEKFGSYPGDGCATVTGTSTTCSTTTPANLNGLLDANEGRLAVNVLQNANILTSSDLKSPFGQDWAIRPGSGANFDANSDYLTLVGVSTSDVPVQAADARFVCALDRLMDDGNPASGAVRSGATYSATQDCWALNGQATIGIRILP